MNEQNGSVSQAELDLLAEGELDTASRDRLLARLGNDATAWKQCAVTLLETQALHRSLSALPTEPDVDPPCLPAPPITHGQKNRLIGLASLAAMLLFALGWWYGRYVDGTSQLQALHQDVTAVDGSVSDGAMQLADDPELRRLVDNTLRQLPVNDGQVVAVLNMNDSQGPLVPVLRSPSLEAQWRRQRPVRIHPGALRKLNRAGWSVVQQRQLLSVEVPRQDSQIVPVDLLRYQFVGVATY